MLVTTSQSVLLTTSQSVLLTTSTESDGEVFQVFHRFLTPTHVRDDHGELGVQGVVQLADGTLVAPEGVVVLAVLCVRVAGCGEQLVPGRGVGEGLRHAVGRLPAQRNATVTTTTWTSTVPDPNGIGSF